MPNEEHLAILRSGVEAWNEWRNAIRSEVREGRRTELDARPNLSRARLTHMTLVGADLSNAKLSYADLGGSNLSEADLTCANLYRARLRDARLDHARLNRALLAHAN